MRKDKIVDSILYAILLILFSFLGCQKEATVPQHLLGVWKTPSFEPEYADRYLKLTEDSLIFGVGEGREVSHQILKIKFKQEKNEIIYTFRCRDSEGGKWTFSFTYRTDSGGTIQLGSRDEIWKKVESGGI